MEPPSIESGRVRVALSRRYTPDELQWSRPRSRAEGSSSAVARRASVSFNGAALDRERKDLQRRNGHAHAGRASMEPPSIESGRFLSEFDLPLVDELLQWSRPRSRAEGHDDGPDATSRGVLQWSRPRSRAEGSVKMSLKPRLPNASMEPPSIESGRPSLSDCLFVAYVPGFNGAALDRERKVADPARWRSNVSCFNGAALDRERKACATIGRVDNRSTASMEPPSIESGRGAASPWRTAAQPLQWSRPRSRAEGSDSHR